MRKFFLFFCGCLCLFCMACFHGETENEGAEPAVFCPQLMTHLQILCAEDMGGREAGTADEAEAALYLAHFLQEKGLQPAGEGETYFQSFPLPGYQTRLSGRRMVFWQDSTRPSSTSENVLALLPGEQREIIVLSAHYDHLGIINQKLYPGANDNASGVAAILEIARALSEYQPQKTILFAFWGAEEKGLWGSKFFCAHPTIPLAEIECVLNLDTVGNLTEKTLWGWRGSVNDANQEIIALLSARGWQIDWEESREHNSDHYSFAPKGIPAFTLLSPHWLEKNHTFLDQIEELNLDLLADLVVDLVNILRQDVYK